MKKILIAILFLLFHCHLQAGPTVCLNMIVKDEAQVICRCLESVKPLIDSWVIVDTGSKDGTQQIIQEFLKEIPGELHERPWVNFAHNRNEALNLAKNKADYLLIIDADDALEFPKDYRLPPLDKSAYRIKVQHGPISYPRIHFVNTSHNWKWGGVVHEALDCDEPTTIGDLDGITLLFIGGGDRSADPDKYVKDAQILEKALEEEPDNTRYVFYLAQSYRDAGMPELALIHYQHRVDMGGWQEEVFWSLYQIALLHESLNRPEDVVTNSYLKAWKYRPTRTEPLYRLSSYYRRRDNHLPSYLLSRFAMQIPRPDDLLFVDSWVYDFGNMFENSISAWWIGRYEESYQLCLQLLSQESLPQHIRDCVAKNLTFVIPKLSP